MSLTVASTFARRGRHVKAIGPASIGSLGAGALPRHRQQTRSYRFGRLSSYLEPYIRPDIYSRHSCQGHKYCENLYRRRPWVKHALAEDAKSTLKRVVSNYWCAHRRGGQVAGRFLNTHAASARTPDNPDGVRPGHNIEDVERAPLEHLLFGDKKSQPPERNSASRLGQKKAVSSTGDVDGGYVIDPITNRKVPKRPDTAYSTLDQGVEIPIRRFKHYRPQFEPFRAPEVERDQTPIFSDGPPPEAELRMYRQTHPPESSEATSASQKTPAADHYGFPHPSLLDTLKWEHRDVQWHPHDNITPASVVSAAKSWPHPANPPEYPDLHQYTGVRYREPDGKPADEQAAQDCEELDKYGAVRAHEPDGKYKVEPQPEASPEELSKYGAVRSHEPDGKYNVESEPSAAPQELNEYGAVRSHEPDGMYAAEYTEAPDEAELASYRKPFLAHEPDGKYALNHVEPESDAVELAKYRQPFFSYEPDGKYAASYLQSQQDEAELSRYKAFRSHEPDGKYAATYVEEKPDPDELATYGAFRSHEPDGKYAAETKAGIGAVKEEEDLANHEAFGYEDLETRRSPQESHASKDTRDLEGYRAIQHDEPERRAETSAYEDYDPEELRKYQAVRWNEPDGKPVEAESPVQTLFEYDVKGETPEKKTTFQKDVDELMAQAAAECQASANEALSSAQQPADGKSKGLTGNYVRDFPEEFSKSWATDTTQMTSSLLSAEQMVSSDSTIQPALERYSTPAPTPTPTSSSPPFSATKPAEPEPALYKILVYDPTMQCIETAETTSIVPDSAAPLTPAEVLLRISNPAKFFPHFAPLQKQGFEIVSGSGDVLIFRKVRDAMPGSEGKERQDSGPPAAVVGGGGVNPIDMTGGTRGGYTVAAGRFASPTGFVNYDLPPPRLSLNSALVEQSSHDRSSGAGEEKEGVGKKRRKSLPKRVAVGAAWLAGLSYSLGVVSEYFKSGGVDGKGPRGL